MRVYQDRGDAVICVEDEGSSVSAEFRESIFEPFARHGGSIAVAESHASGASFVVRLPLVPSIQGEPVAPMAKASA